MFEALFDHVGRFVKLSAQEKDLLREHLVPRHIHRKAFLLSEGDVCTANYFIVKGCFRMYFIREGGQEQIVQFALDNWWITDHTSLENHKPSDYYIQAVEDSDVIVLTKKNQELLFDRIPLLERYFRLLLQRSHSASLRRLQFLFDMSAEERYTHFSTSYPEFVQRVPQYMLASYLGFTPEVLSKIRAKK